MAHYNYLKFSLCTGEYKITSHTVNLRTFRTEELEASFQKACSVDTVGVILMKESRLWFYS